VRGRQQTTDEKPGDIVKDALQLMVIGPPSGGKTSMSRKLAEHYSCLHVSSGDYARTILTAENAEALAVGDLSPDHLRIAQWVTEKMNANKRIIMDGFPRSLPQFQAFDFKRIDAVVWMDVPVGECLKRAMGRGRVDDDAPVFWRRYMNYMRHTAPLMAELSQAPEVSFVHFIDNGFTLEENADSLIEHIDKVIGG
jgi:adenylate kinase family enzyme